MFTIHMSKRTRVWAQHKQLKKTKKATLDPGAKKTHNWVYTFTCSISAISIFVRFHLCKYFHLQKIITMY